MKRYLYIYILYIGTMYNCTYYTLYGCVLLFVKVYRKRGFGFARNKHEIVVLRTRILFIVKTVVRKWYIS